MNMIDRIKEFITENSDILKELSVDYIVILVPMFIIALVGTLMHFDKMQLMLAGIIYIIIESVYFFLEGEKLESQFPDSC